MSELVLFLGGPLNGQRRAMPDDEHWVNVLPPPRVVAYWAMGSGTIEEPERVRYTRRRVPGSGVFVFVAPDYRFDTVEWVAAAMPDVTGWEHLGQWRWRGRREKPHRCWMYVLGDEQGRGFVAMPAMDEFVADFAGNDEFLFEELHREMQYQCLPLCVVDGCGQKAPMVFTAAEWGRLAGREWRRGEEIRLCPAHAHDVYRADVARSVEELADWLVPDAWLGWFDECSARWDVMKGREPVGVRGRLLPLIDDVRRLNG